MSARTYTPARPRIVPDHLPAKTPGRPAPASVGEVLRSPGEPLDLGTQKTMERRLHHNFADVRVHADLRAGASAREVGALAYTVGRDVVFGKGQFAPRSSSGAALLAHELNHVAAGEGSASAPVLRCFESPEHQDLGDKAFKDLHAFLHTDEGADWAKKYKLDPKATAAISKDIMLVGGTIVVGQNRLTPGEIIALMGDFFRTVEDLKKASQSEVREILDAIQKERKGELSNPNATYQAITVKYRKDKKDTFLELAKVNKPHFTPTNRAAWKELHKQAITKAHQSKDQKMGGETPTLDDALLWDAAGGHFLTDAYASGHLFNKAQIEKEIALYLRVHPATPENPEMKAYYGLIESQDAMGQVVLKNIHDHLNTIGVEVTNKKGMKWRTFGDNTLKKSPETQRIAALAVYMSRQQVERAYKGEVIDEAKYDEVLDLLPDDASVNLATEQARQFIPEAVKTLTMLIYRQRLAGGEGLKALIGVPVLGDIGAAIATSNLTTLSDPLRGKQLLDTQERARQFNTPMVAPQFTLGSF